jgi:hypothetical protein
MAVQSSLPVAQRQPIENGSCSPIRISHETGRAVRTMPRRSSLWVAPRVGHVSRGLRDGSISTSHPPLRRALLNTPVSKPLNPHGRAAGAHPSRYARARPPGSFGNPPAASKRCAPSHHIMGHVTMSAQAHGIDHVPRGSFSTSTAPERCDAATADAQQAGYQRSTRSSGAGMQGGRGHDIMSCITVGLLALVVTRILPWQLLASFDRDPCHR